MGRLHRVARLHSAHATYCTVSHTTHCGPVAQGNGPCSARACSPLPHRPTLHAAQARCHMRRRCIDGAGNGWQQAKWWQATACDGGKRRRKGSNEALTGARGGLGGARDATTGSSSDALRTEEQRVSYGRCQRGRRRRCCSLPVRRPRARRRGALR
jgi:hypothetical protein